ncbi:hypothetical protein PAPYR_2928 [Paratrimastix pyriformis]|uniref:Uncharacterized protein n=1 Tax=Paratrimastix pyriformis TaxID=342808 RepID=A0ABQ8UT36_9EUKA|nr:hypothetical protein PAPYR_2928 [Paratrimastix pyriformis]
MTTAAVENPILPPLCFFCHKDLPTCECPLARVLLLAQKHDYTRARLVFKNEVCIFSVEIKPSQLKSRIYMAAFHKHFGLFRVLGPNSPQIQAFHPLASAADLQCFLHDRLSYRISHQNEELRRPELHELQQRFGTARDALAKYTRESKHDTDRRLAQGEFDDVLQQPHHHHESEPNLRDLISVATEAYQSLRAYRLAHGLGEVPTQQAQDVKTVRNGPEFEGLAGRVALPARLAAFPQGLVLGALPNVRFAFKARAEQEKPPPGAQLEFDFLLVGPLGGTPVGSAPRVEEPRAIGTETGAGAEEAEEAPVDVEVLEVIECKTNPQDIPASLVSLRRGLAYLATGFPGATFPHGGRQYRFSPASFRAFRPLAEACPPSSAPCEAFVDRLRYYTRPFRRFDGLSAQASKAILAEVERPRWALARQAALVAAAAPGGQARADPTIEEFYRHVVGPVGGGALPPASPPPAAPGAAGRPGGAVKGIPLSGEPVGETLFVAEIGWLLARGRIELISPLLERRRPGSQWAPDADLEGYEQYGGEMVGAEEAGAEGAEAGAG